MVIIGVAMGVMAGSAFRFRSRLLSDLVLTPAIAGCFTLAAWSARPVEIALACLAGAYVGALRPALRSPGRRRRAGTVRIGRGELSGVRG